MYSAKKYPGVKKTGTAILLIILSFSVYVMIANSNSKNMTTRQKILKAVYPAIMWFTKKTDLSSNSVSNTPVEPIVPFYTLPAILTDGKKLDLNDLKGKKILLVNTASDCGYTGQFDELEKLQQTYKEKLVILGFPANDFKEQEKGTDENIAAFCRLNFGVTFPLFKKSQVVKGSGQHEIFQWLTDKNKNGWNNQAPTWNFCKYLVDEHGRLIHYFSSSVAPMSDKVLKAIVE